jgi:hypothetical protein
MKRVLKKREVVRDRETRTIDVKRIGKPRQHIFPDLVNNRASIDKIVISASGELNETFREKELVNINPKSIFHPGGHYAACIFGVWRVTRNPVSIHHGRMVKFKNVPPLRFTMQSENVPVTAAQVNLFVKKCTSASPELTVSSLELTFDFTGTSVEDIGGQLIHRAKQVKTLTDERGWKTIYVGSPRSSWQVRIYQKTASVVRLEFVLRRGFLSRHGITRPEDVLLLRRIDVWRLVSFRQFSHSRAKRVARNLKSRTDRRLIGDWPQTWRSKESLLQVLKRNRISADTVFRRTSLQARLRQMQRRLVW